LSIVYLSSSVTAANAIADSGGIFERLRGSRGLK
jgi:hypothetical protein